MRTKMYPSPKLRWKGFRALSVRVHVPNIWVLRVLVIVITVQVLGKYMLIRILGPLGFEKDRSRCKARSGYGEGVAAFPSL